MTEEAPLVTLVDKLLEKGLVSKQGLLEQVENVWVNRKDPTDELAKTYAKLCSIKDEPDSTERVNMARERPYNRRNTDYEQMREDRRRANIDYRHPGPQRFWRNRQGREMEIEAPSGPVWGPTYPTAIAARGPVTAPQVQNFDQGHFLYCNNLPTVTRELEQWIATMDIVLGQTYNAWDNNAKLNYIIMCLKDRALKTWTAIRNSDRYNSIVEDFNASNGKGLVIAKLIRNELLGSPNLAEDEVKRKQEVLNKLNELSCHNLASIHIYNEQYMDLMVEYGDLRNEILLNGYFSKLPREWARTLSDSYVAPASGDNLGKRQAFVAEKLKEDCRTRNRLKESSQHYWEICQALDPDMRLGYADRSNSYTRRPYRRRMSVRQPREDRKKTNFPPPPKIEEVVCYGCKQIGHYASKCPNRKPERVKVINEENLGPYRYLREPDDLIIFSDDDGYPEEWEQF